MVLKTGFTKLTRGSAIDQTFVSPTQPWKFALNPNLQCVGDGAFGRQLGHKSIDSRALMDKISDLIRDPTVSSLLL